MNITTIIIHGSAPLTKQEIPGMPIPTVAGIAWKAWMGGKLTGWDGVAGVA